MARILYGVMGDARGHVTRAITLSQELKRHEFLFVGGGAVGELRNYGYDVIEVPMAATFYKNNRVDISTTLKNASRVFCRRKHVIPELADIIRQYDPHLIITDYEYFIAQAAKAIGMFCVSLDNQHILTHCEYVTPRGQRLSRYLTLLPMRLIYSNASLFIITSFFQLKPKNPNTTRVFPPLIRREVVSLGTSCEEHALVYLTSHTFKRLLPALEKTKSKFIVYGFHDEVSRKNLIFKRPATDEFLNDLASCRYLITNGGHSAVSEALFLNKPVLAIPIANAYEQWMNSHYIRLKGYGDSVPSGIPNPGQIKEFESGLEQFKDNIRNNSFIGNREIAIEIENMLKQNKTW
jgi:uncharacterized protein (TIGR00661 family)